MDVTTENHTVMRRRILAALVAACALAALAGPSSAAGRYKVLGTDPELDAGPSMDLTELSVAGKGKTMAVRIGIANMTPPFGSAIPLLPGVQWAFEVKGRTFVAEAYTDPRNGPGFPLFEIKDDGGFEQILNMKGTYDWEDGFVEMLVPLKAIGAKKRTKISGIGNKGAGGTNDVDFHIHLGPRTEYTDTISTTKDFIVP